MAILSSLLWVGPSLLWIPGLTVLVMAGLTLVPGRWLRWMGLSASSLLFFATAIFIGRTIATGLSWSLSPPETGRLARLGIAVSIALGLGEALREDSFLLPLLWRLGGPMAALTWYGARRQRVWEQKQAAVHATRGKRSVGIGESVRHLTYFYWNYAPMTAVALALRGYNNLPLSAPSFPSWQRVDLAIALVTATCIILPFIY